MTGNDAVGRIIEQWNRERPDVDVSPLEVIGRVSRLSRLVDRILAENFARHDIEAWMFDVMATLRRSGEPYELSAGQLVGQMMVTTGAMTNRIDRMEQRGLVERVPADDRRKVIVRLTPEGLRLVNEVVVTHLATEEGILAGLSTQQRDALAGTLERMLIELSDRGDVERG